MKSRKTRVVLDTNVLVSGILFSGKEAEILDAAAAGAFDALSSLEIMEEFVDVIARPKFQLTSDEVATAYKFILSFVKLTVSVEHARIGVRDKEDVRILECAREAKAGWLVTGDKDLLTLRTFHRTLIVTPSKFLRRLRAHRLWQRSDDAAREDKRRSGDRD